MREKRRWGYFRRRRCPTNSSLSLSRRCSLKAALTSSPGALCIPQLQKTDAQGSIRPRYDVSSLASSFSSCLALALNVSPDWGGSLDDLGLLPSKETPVLSTR